MTDIGQRIKEARKKAHLTQKELAIKSGVATITIQQYESGKRTPQIEPLIKISNALNIDLEKIVDYPTAPSTFPLPIDSGMLATLDWHAKRNNRTIYKELDIAIDFYLDSLARLGELSDENDNIIKDNYIDSDNFLDLIESYEKLSRVGKEKAIERVKELAKIPEYQKENTTPDEERTTRKGRIKP